MDGLRLVVLDQRLIETVLQLANQTRRVVVLILRLDRVVLEIFDGVETMFELTRLPNRLLLQVVVLLLQLLAELLQAIELLAAGGGLGDDRRNVSRVAQSVAG
jgi:hypothetical protein